MLTPGPSVRGCGARCRRLGSGLLDLADWEGRGGLDDPEGLLGDCGPVGELGEEKEPLRLPARLPGLEEPEDEAARDLAELRASKACTATHVISLEDVQGLPDLPKLCSCRA